jgi:cell division protein FtsW (lipid II flippase)
VSPSPRTRELLWLSLALSFCAWMRLQLALTRAEPGLFAALLELSLLAGVFGLSHLFLRRIAPKADPAFLPLAALLSGVGWIFLLRLGPALASFHDNEGYEALPRKQALYLLAGGAAFVAAAYASGARLFTALSRKTYAYALLASASLLATGLFGAVRNGRRLWLPLGPFTFQTVELVKLLVVLFVASYLARRPAVPGRAIGLGLEIPRLRHLGPLAFLAVLVMVPLFLQKDLGPAILFGILFLAMYYVAYGNAGPSLLGAALVLLAVSAAYAAGVPSILRTRVDYWLDPFGRSENMARSLWAIARGGAFGSGFGRGAPQEIPVVQSDFNFAGLSEELGLGGAALVLGAFAALSARAIAAARRAPDDFRHLVGVGLAVMLGAQALLIVGGVTGAIPLTGITLPFVSFGGSALILNFATLGVLARLSHDGAAAE